MKKVNNIENLQGYTNSMKKSLLDKIFFIDKVDATTFLDFGCADGTLLSFLEMLFPENRYIGYDISEEMIKKASANHPLIAMFNYFEKALDECGASTRAILLISVLHELYSYGTLTDIEQLWERVFNRNHDYIVIRDFIPSYTVQRKADLNNIRKIYSKANKSQLYDFERIWGTIEDNKNMLHFLLKYSYTDNWEREVRENYLPLFREELLSNIPDSYEIIYHDHFVLPYTKVKVKRDFDIDIVDNTHLKLILKRKI